MYADARRIPQPVVSSFHDDDDDDDDDDETVHFSRHIAPQIPTPEKWNKIKTLCILVISLKMLKYFVKK